MDQLHQEINQQNQALQENNVKYAEADSSDMQYTMYEMKDISTLQEVNWYLFVIFYIVAAVICFLVLTNEKWNMYVKLAVAIVILIFPFVIYSLEYGLYYLASYLYSLITFMPFNSAYLAPYQPKTYETAFNNRYYQL